MAKLSEKFHLKSFSISQSYNLPIAETIRIWAVPLSLATTKGITFVFFSSGYLDVSVHRVDLRHNRITCCQVGLSHSDIYGSKVICTSPQLFAAYHVLLRLWEPRHSPYALINFLLFIFPNMSKNFITLLSTSRTPNRPSFLLPDCVS